MDGRAGSTSPRRGGHCSVRSAVERFAALADLGVDLAIVDLPDAQDAGVFDFLAALSGELEPLGRPVPAVLAPAVSEYA